jgi:hypothetical protein
LINLIDVQNFPEEILIKYLTYIYSLESDFYKDMNKYLSTEGKQGIYEAFISLMYRGLYLDVFAKNQEYNKLKLYRAQLMNKEEFNNIKNLFEKKMIILYLLRFFFLIVFYLLLIMKRPIINF